MALPRVLKNFNVFVNGDNFKGVCESVTLPKFKKKADPYRGAGMIGEVDLEFGWEKFQCSVDYAGFDTLIISQLKVCGVSDLPIRFVGLYERQDTCTFQAVEWYMRGNALEYDPNSEKLGQKSDYKVTYTVSYCRLIVDGVQILEIDVVNGIEVWGETDLIATLAGLLGL